MACEVLSIGHLSHVDKVRSNFGPCDENWLNSITCSISPTGDLIVLAMGQNLAFCLLSPKPEETYTLTFYGKVEDVEANEIVTAVLCLPMRGKSFGEWNLIVIGLSSGRVLFYNEVEKIYAQRFNDDQVLSIKAYSPQNALSSEAECFLYIVYDECVCILKGADTFPQLRKIKREFYQQSSRRAGNEARLEISVEVLQYSKFLFSREHGMVLNDGAVTKTQRSCTYDHIIEQCLTAGIYARISENPIRSSLVIGVGAEPYMGLYSAEEGYKTISLSEVAKDVIGMAYRNLFSNVFGRTQKQPSPDETQQSPTTTKESHMRTRCRFYDGKRDGFRIVLSPNGRLAAVTDNLDRVMLVDTQRCVVLNIFKGYREAQCGFICVKEKSLKSSAHLQKRKALFLVIYAPRLGCLEIFALQHGGKIAAFNVSKNGQLIYNTHGLLGEIRSTKEKAYSCFFFDPIDGSVKIIQIPFHFALSETTSKTSRDVHMLRRLKRLLKDVNAQSSSTEEDIEQLAAEFETVEVKQQCIEMLKKSREIKPEIFHIIVKAFSANIKMKYTEEKETVLDEDTAQLLCTMENLERLTNFYINMQSSAKSNFEQDLEFSDSDLAIINQFILLCSEHKAQTKTRDNAKPTGNVTFVTGCKTHDNFVDYLDIFELNYADRIPLQRSKSNNFANVSSKLFAPFFQSGLNVEYFKSKAAEAGIPCEDLLELALNYWLEKKFVYDSCDAVISDMSQLAAMVWAISELAGERASDFAYNAISPWWQEVREMLLNSPKSLSLLVAMVCKIVALNMWRNQRDDSCDEASQVEGGENEQWQRICHEEAQWSLLIGKLEDIAILGAVLDYPILSMEPIMPELPFINPDYSLKLIVTGGKGIVSDLTSQWLINSRIHPKLIVENEVKGTTASLIESENEKKDLDVSPTPDGSEELVEKEDAVLKRLALLRQHFPFSCESSMLLSQMSWQYMVHWSKHLNSVKHLRAAIVCLEQFDESAFALKHGMCCLMWNAALKFPLQSTMKLIHKVGHLPVNSMCLQDIGMPAAFLPEFLELAIDFIKQFASSSSSMQHEKRELRFEEILVEGQLPLQSIALRQNVALKELLQLHNEALTAFYFITFFQLRVPRPISRLFDALTKKALMADINKELPFVLQMPDLVLQQLRTEFLCNVITASMDLIREDMQELYVAEHLEFMKKIVQLAKSWKLDLVPLKQHQVIQMYAHGYDFEAEKLLKQLGDVEALGASLIIIAGRRLNLYASTSQRRYLYIASVGQQIMQFLDELIDSESESTTTVMDDDTELSENTKSSAASLMEKVQITATEPKEIEIETLGKLVINAIECLSKSGASTSPTLSRYWHVCGQMYDACSVLRNETKS